ncbi:MAG: hypothetical protein HOF71_05510 [Chloroflexi bacterium]|jgi:hypothetical protein|nr:hypothetical protein [Chloroflexota bacterium]
MLKDKLTEILESPSNQWNCRMPQVFRQQDEETRIMLRTVLKGPASTRSITTALNVEGHKVSRDAVDHARRILKGQLKCSCLLLLTEGASENE